MTALSLKSFKRDRSRSTVSRRAYQELPGYSLCESIDSYNQGFEKFQIKREWCLFTLNFDYHGQANIALVKDARQIRGRVTRRRVRPVLFPPSPSDTGSTLYHILEKRVEILGGSFLIFCEQLSRRAATPRHTHARKANGALARFWVNNFVSHEDTRL